MANIYVDPAAAGANDGTSWGDAYTSLASATAAAIAGDIIKARGTQVLAAGITTTANGAAATPIQLIGCNAAGNEDGTYFVLDGNDAVATVFTLSKTNWLIRNLEVKNATGIGFYNNGGSYAILWNIYSHDNNTYGFYGASDSYSMGYKLRAESNTSGGMYNFCNAGIIAFSTVKNHTAGAAVGVYLGNTTLIGCVIHNSAGDGVQVVSGVGGGVIGCVIDGNGADGVAMGNASKMIIGNRFTNNGAYGVDMTNNQCTFVDDWNFYLNNTSGTFSTPAAYTRYTGTGNTVVAGTEGYANKAGDDFTITDAATNRRIAITVGAI